MFRTALYGSLGALGLTGFTATADAHHPHRHAPVARPVPIVTPVPVVTPVPLVRQYYPVPAPVCHSWIVLYRSCEHDPWRTYDSYRSVDAARHAARHLRHTGYRTRIAVG